MNRDNAVKIVFILLNFLIILTLTSAAIGQDKAKKGVLDLRNELIRNNTIMLNGEWEFYWGKHLRPPDFHKDKYPVPDIYGKVPSYWINYSSKIPQIKNFGYATYRLNILLPDNIGKIVFDIPVFDSAFRIYIDGKYAGGNGLAGENGAETMPEYDPFTYEHTVIDDTVEVIINVSNFHHRRGGFWLPINIGTPEAVIKNLEQKKILSDISAGMLLSLMVFFFVFFVIFKTDHSMLYFSLATLGMLLRSISTGTFTVMTLTDISWVSLIRLEYTGSFIALIFGAWYFYRIFPDKYFRIINTIITVLFSIGTLLVLSTPVMFFSNSIRIFLPVMSLILIYYSVKSIISLKKDMTTGILNTIGFIALLLGAINDAVLSGSNIFIFSSYITPYATIIFIFMQVIIIINRWVNSLKQEKHLMSELEYINQNLENIVIERTSELTNQKSELERQKEEIVVKNKELENNIRIKDRVFSIIEHDLKSPVFNLEMLIENLKDIPDQENRNTFIEEISKQVNFSINLIDNLLMWWQAQQNKLDYRPGKWNMTDIVLESFNLLNTQAELKNVHLSYSHRGSPKAWCDRHLVNIILRNFITNAIKFTNDNGKIYVSVEEISDLNPHLKISVRDTGVGIDYENLESLRVNKITKSTTGTQGEKGTGLGLQLCYELIKVNMGDMQIDSTRGEGTTVSFTLPIQSDQILI